jgi:hypothetical protein
MDLQSILKNNGPALVLSETEETDQGFSLRLIHWDHIDFSA